MGNLYKQIILTISFIVILGIMFGCDKSQPFKEIPVENSKENKEISKENSKGINELILNLEKLGFYKYSEPSKIEEIKTECIKFGYVYGWEDTYRDFHVDAESIAEGGFEGFYKEINAFMEKQGIKLIVSDVIYSGYLYSVKINDVNYEILKGDEFEKENWEFATDRCFSIINKVLMEKGTKERIYKLYGGNDLRAVFLTEEMYNEIRSFKELSEKEKPRSVPEV